MLEQLRQQINGFLSILILRFFPNQKIIVGPVPFVIILADLNERYWAAKKKKK